jgi:hypothetical protein
MAAHKKHKAFDRTKTVDKTCNKAFNRAAGTKTIDTAGNKTCHPSDNPSDNPSGYHAAVEETGYKAVDKTCYDTTCQEAINKTGNQPYHTSEHKCFAKDKTAA